jgi:hypothetical protein
VLRLIALGEGTEDTKRRITYAELDAGSDVDVVLEAMAKARLLTLGESSVEISHEALIRSWPRLRDWLAEDREGLRVHRQLTEAAQAWTALDHDPGALYRGTRLALAQDLASTRKVGLTVREHEFLQASLAAEATEQTASRRRARRLRQLVAILSVLFLLAGTATVLAIRHSRAPPSNATRLWPTRSPARPPP